MTRQELLAQLQLAVQTDPMLFNDAVSAMTFGLQQALDAANKHAADMETLFVMSAMHGKLPTKQRDRDYLATILERWAPQSRFNFAHTITELRRQNSKEGPA